MEKIIRFVAAFTALTGGAVLVALVILTCVSVAGRALSKVGLGPIPGDFEYVEMGIAFAIFCFLPWCHLNKANATVELFAGLFRPGFNRALDVVSDLLMLLAAGLITWRLYLGTMDKKSYFETTFILQTPVWWAYAACLIGAVVFTIVAVYCLARSVQKLAAPHSD